MEDIRLYDEVTESKESSLPIDEAFKQIEAKREKSKCLTNLPTNQKQIKLLTN